MEINFKKNIFLEYKAFILPTLVMILLLVLTPYFLIPKAKQILNWRKEIEGQQKRIDLLSTKVNDLKFISEAELSSTNELFLSALPTEKDFYLLMANLQKIFGDEGSKIDFFQLNPGLLTSMSAEPSELGKSDEQIKVKVTFEADENKLANIIEKIEKTFPLMAVSTLRIDSLHEASGSGLLAAFQGSMDILGFFSPFPKTLGKIDSVLPKMTAEKKTFVEKLKDFNRYSFENLQPSGDIVVGKANPFQ